MSNAILVINAGSSSLKFSVFRDHGGGDPVVTLNGQISGIGTQPVFEAKDAQRRPLAGKSWEAEERSDRKALLSYLLDWIEERLDGATLIAAGHRVVHGGVRHAAPVLLTPAVMDELDGLVPLAPLHQPHNLAAIRALAEAHPELPQVACFDTAFHRNQPWQAQTFAIPRELTEEGVRRYGFHGLSYEYIARRLPEIAPELGDSRVVVAHLGSGASMCAIHGGRSVDSTMGFTALDGLPMGTRCGTIDPGVLIYLMRKGMDADGIEKMLYNKSGLLGVSGISNDMRALLESTDPHAQEAVELFCFRIAKETGALAASMGGVDALVFTAGIGERSAPVRARVGDKLAWMGMELDDAANEANAAKISTPGSRLPVYVIPTDEERMIALHTRRVLTGR
ncbi:acetate kinase [Azospirillum thiophilum]|uniref:Acetate kinase n=1 Tax=Azospirillum thiophilum TaxID=528244 RepID=A0AAC8VYU8_9PROT|nr:acetate/propionate family kinase [Azospirillum thiophilum]ALG71882.1 acetate kinase [Azospirillum thiophilum]KJR67322.1 acetate kinase [Azospirillum thiophilum]